MNTSSKVLSIILLTLTCVSCRNKKYTKPGEDLQIHFFEMSQAYSDSFLIKYNNFEILVDGGNYSDVTQFLANLKIIAQMAF